MKSLYLKYGELHRAPEEFKVGPVGVFAKTFLPKNGPDFEVEFGLEVTVLAVIVLLYNKFQVFFTLYLSDADQDKTISFI